MNFIFRVQIMGPEYGLLIWTPFMLHTQYIPCTKQGPHNDVKENQLRIAAGISHGLPQSARQRQSHRHWKEPRSQNVNMASVLKLPQNGSAHYGSDCNTGALINYLHFGKGNVGQRPYLLPTLRSCVGLAAVSF